MVKEARLHRCLSSAREPVIEFPEGWRFLLRDLVLYA